MSYYDLQQRYDELLPEDYEDDNISEAEKQEAYNDYMASLFYGAD